MQNPVSGSSQHRWYVLGVLVLIYMMHHLDRVVFSLLQEPIKQEFSLSDTQLALLTGTVYAIAFGAAGLPLGYLADRTRRVTLLAAIVTTWSGLTALASFATQFTQMLVLRAGIGAAESGSTPTNLSILSDLFREKRSTAIGIYMMGSQLGTFVGFAVTGVVAIEYGWRAALLVAGIPGLFLALLLLLTVREPERQSAQQPGSLSASLREISAKPTLFHLIAATVAINIVGPGITTWIPSLLMRAGGQSIEWTGLAFAITTGPLGIAGALLAGVTTEKIAKKNPARMCRLMAFLALLFIPAILVAVSGGALTMLTGYCVGLFFTMFVSTAGYAMCIEGAESHLRGSTAALLQVLSNLIGFGVGPVVGGLLSDLLRPLFGDDSLRYALGIFVFLALWAVFHLLRAGSLFASHAAERQQ